MIVDEKAFVGPILLRGFLCHDSAVDQQLMSMGLGDCEHSVSSSGDMQYQSNVENIIVGMD